VSAHCLSPPLGQYLRFRSFIARIGPPNLSAESSGTPC